MRVKKAPAKSHEPDDRVRLKPFLGMRPGVYLAAIYLAALAALVFVFLFLPGIRNPGARIVFTSEPSGAVIRVDGVHAGTSPARFFAPAGSRSVEVALPGFQTERSEHAIPRRAFASRFFPRRYALSVTLTAPDPAAALAIAAAEYAAWSFGGEATATWQVPRALSEGVYRIGPAAASEEAREIVAASARFASTRSGLRDLVRAQALADSGGNSPSPLGIANSVAQIAAFLDGNPASALWLADLLPPDAAAALASSAWHREQVAGAARAADAQSLAPNPATTAPGDVGLPAAQVQVGGLLFAGLGGGALAQGEPHAHVVPVESFFVSVAQVPASAFAAFLDANPKWRRDNIEELQRLGLATGDYLADFGTLSPGGGWSGAGVSAVSWHAAQAFCEWLTSMLPPELSGWEARLPTEAEWEFAAKSAELWNNLNGTFAPSNGTWEWCREPFAPLPFLGASARAIDAVGSPERPVRGGSWLNAAGVTTAETRGFLPPASASPFVSFRPVIARRAD